MKEVKRKPLALANWKMAMTISRGLEFIRRFRSATGDLVRAVDVVICPPCTAIFPLSQALLNTPLALGAQNFYSGTGEAHTGEVSAPLLRDAGCKWAMLGHWEVRRRTGDSDLDVNKKIHEALRTGLRPIVLLGEGASERGIVEEALYERLSTILAGCGSEDVGKMAILYEPEWTIGKKEAAPPAHVGRSCSIIRTWTARTYGEDAAARVRILYGGSVAPENVRKLLTSEELDGLGVGRKGRDPESFARIVHRIAAAKGLA